MVSNEGTICPLPWSHLYVSPHGKMSVCCTGQTISEYTSKPLQEFWNSESVKQLRLDLLSGKRNNICKNCYKHEDLGIKSMRQGFLESMSHIVDDIPKLTNEDGSVDEFKLKYMDFRFNNLCNFKCRSCNEGFSSSIASETATYKKLNSLTNIKSPVFAKNTGIIDEFKLHLPYIESIYFAGGEPMMQEEHWSILEELINLNLAKNVKLIYSTNCSTLTFKNKSILDYWKHFKLVIPQLSIDAEGKRAEYWRDGTVWEEVLNNIKLISQEKHIQWKIHSTISWVNIYSYIDLVKLLIESGLTVGHNLSIWCLDDKSQYSLQGIPEFKKIEIENALNEFLIYLKNLPRTKKAVENIENIKRFMFDKSINVNKTYFTRHNLLDEIRKKDFFEYFPEHENMREYMT